MNKWHIEDSAVCSYCNEENEDIVHMFWTCRCTQEFWQLFKQYCEPKLDIHLNINTVFLGADDNIVSNLLFVAKRFIYNKRIHQEQLTLANFKAQLFKQRNVEHVIAKSKDNLSEWVEKWDFLN